ncbi:MAG: magnesium-translocating P-type ATPase [Cyanobacteria bacterium]|nr:magnesium-translocating P-type ATPase [Cyanobacteriota bacterium]
MVVAEAQKSGDTYKLGLSSIEAKKRLQAQGPNELGAKQKSWLLHEILPLVTSPLVLILLVAAIVSAWLGEIFNASLIALMIVLSSSLSFVQSYRSNKGVEKLRRNVALTATVLRDGVWQQLLRSVIVPGDVIKLSAGNLVPADARLFSANDLHVNEASLTGESMPVEKQGNPLTADEQFGETVYLGSSVVSGFGEALVTATGNRTNFGGIAGQLAMRAPETEFEKGTRQFGLLIMKTVLFLIIFVFLVSAVLHRDPLQSLLFAVALGIGLTPEFLPMILTVTLGQGAMRMARHKVIVKHLAAIQNLGSMDVLCSDKTGTLTTGETAVEDHVDLEGKSSERVFLLAYLNSAHETGELNILNQAILDKASGNPLDCAILHHDHPSVESYHKLDEIPFDFERRRLSVVVQAGDQRWLITKGSPENVIDLASRCEISGQVVPMSLTLRQQCQKTYQDFSNQGLRVLAVAWRDIEVKSSYEAADEKDLVLVGFITFIDPPVEEAAGLIQSLKTDGVRVMILTGDNDLVTRHVCEGVGIPCERIILGPELEHMTDSALSHLVETNSIFARLKPAQKNRIILALKRRGHVVGFLGDGINDAPALHVADVGISVANASDVAKESAEIILLEPSLRAIHEGIIEGRRSLANVLKYLLMGTSSNFGNMFSMAGAAMFLPFLPMLPTQILLNNFLYDLAQISIPTDNVDRSFIQRPQRWNISLIKKFMLFVGPISSVFDFLTFYIMLQVLHANERMFHTGWFVESLATQTLVLFIIRTAQAPWKSKPSLPLAITTIGTVVVAVILPFSPFSEVLGFSPLPPIYFAALVAMVIPYLILVEIMKQKLFHSLSQ